MSASFGIFSVLGLLMYGVMIGLVILVICTLLLAIKALKIYINKNS